MEYGDCFHHAQKKEKCQEKFSIKTAVPLKNFDNSEEK